MHTLPLALQHLESHHALTRTPHTAMASIVVARAAARPVQVCCSPDPAHVQPDGNARCIQQLSLVPRCSLQAARSSSRPQARAAFRAPARALYFHTRQSVIAMAAEVSNRGLHMRRRRLSLLPPCAPQLRPTPL